MAHVQVAVGLRREPRVDATIVFAAGQIVEHDLADEIVGGSDFVHTIAAVVRRRR